MIWPPHTLPAMGGDNTGWYMQKNGSGSQQGGSELKKTGLSTHLGGAGMGGGGSGLVGAGWERGRGRQPHRAIIFEELHVLGVVQAYGRAPNPPLAFLGGWRGRQPPGG